ncbi:MAG TPA: response regulator [Cyclobacteriaceae bacterium]|nr:response regulator [Cyclobacteriaceae bacterium]
MENFDLVYVVDDDPLYIFSMKKVLGITDFCQESMFFKNGQEALDDLIPRLSQAGKLPDIIFLDISMPLMNGWQFLDKLKTYPIHQEMKIFIVSSSIDPYDTGKSASYEIVTDYIYKPITIDKMKELKTKLLA